MKIDRHGQAKILSDDELRIVFAHGFTCARNQAIGAASLYLATRISETVQLFTRYTFNGDSVCHEIYIPQEITKGKIASRTIPTHSALAGFLEKYNQESQKLLRLYDENGNWSHKSFDSDGKYISYDFVCSCGGTRLVRDGFYTGEQRYTCRTCRRTSLQRQMVSSVNSISLTKKDFLGVDSSIKYGFFNYCSSEYLFPGMGGKGHITARAGISICDEAFERVGILGASSHSFRRTCLTKLYKANVPLPVIQKISGHRNLDKLQRYLEVDPEDKDKAIDSLDY